RSLPRSSRGRPHGFIPKGCPFVHNNFSRASLVHQNPHSARASSKATGKKYVFPFIVNRHQGSDIGDNVIGRRNKQSKSRTEDDITDADHTHGQLAGISIGLTWAV